MGREEFRYQLGMSGGSEESHAVYTAIRHSLGHVPRETAFPNLTSAYGSLDKQYVERTSVPPGSHPHWTAYYPDWDWGTNAEIYRLNSMHAQIADDDNKYRADNAARRQTEAKVLQQRNQDFVEAMRNARNTHAREDLDRYLRAQALYNDRRVGGELALKSGFVFTPEEAASRRSDTSFTTSAGAQPAGCPVDEPYKGCYPWNHPFPHWSNYITHVPPYAEAARGHEISLLETNAARLDCHPSALHPGRPYPA